MSMNAIESGELPPVQASRVQALDFGGNPARFILRRCKFHNTNFLALGFVRHQFLLGYERRVIDESDYLGGGAEDVGRGPVVIDQRLHEARGTGAITARNMGE